MKNILPKFKSFSLEDYRSITTFNIEETYAKDARPALVKIYSKQELALFEQPEVKPTKRKPRRNRLLSVGGEGLLDEVSPLSEQERGVPDKPLLVLPEPPSAVPSTHYFDPARARTDNFRISLINELKLDIDLILQRAGSIHTNIVPARTGFTR